MSDIITHLFYILGIFVFFNSLENLIKYKKIYDTSIWIKKFIKVTSKTPLPKDFRTANDYYFFKSVSKNSLFEFIWMSIGLATPEFYIFLYLISFKMILRYINSDLIHRYFGLIFNITKVILVIFIVVNHFHLHLKIPTPSF